MIDHHGICSASSYAFTGRSSDRCRDKRCDKVVNIKAVKKVIPNNEEELKVNYDDETGES